MASVNGSTEMQRERDLLAAILADLTALRADIIALHVKLDADAGITDVDYASTLVPAALTTTA